MKLEELKNKVIQGDCLEKLKELEDNSIDSIVTDPPYELGFMGKSWDNTGIANNKEMWVECLRVLKPGGHLLSFGGTRTYHRMAVAIEDAGFEVRDMIEWVYGSGFPKSLNIGKAVDKLQGNEREVTGERKVTDSDLGQNSGWNPLDTSRGNYLYSKGTSEWEGWGTALKPAHEPICMARKPLSEKTVALNVLKYGTGGINIDESRVGMSEDDIAINTAKASKEFTGVKPFGEEDGKGSALLPNNIGRFPANFLHDNSEEVRECFPETKSQSGGNRGKTQIWGNADGEQERNGFDDSGNASRFFKSIIYQAKASKSERNKGLDCYLTIKYNGVITDNNKTLCKEENMVAVQLLQKVISEQELVNFNIDESGVNIMVQCHKDSLSTISTKIKQTTESKIYNWLMHLLTNEYTQVVNSEMVSGGNFAIPVKEQNELTNIIGIYQKKNGFNMENVKSVISSVLSLISEEENWKQKTNIHSTVKPVALMEYLIKMITPENGVVLDPFAGSGTTGVACKNTNRNYILIEKEQEYIDIINKRLN